MLVFTVGKDRNKNLHLVNMKTNEWISSSDGVRGIGVEYIYLPKEHFFGFNSVLESADLLYVFLLE